MKNEKHEMICVSVNNSWRKGAVAYSYAMRLNVLLFVLIRISVNKSRIKIKTLDKCKINAIKIMKFSHFYFALYKEMNIIHLV